MRVRWFAVTALTALAASVGAPALAQDYGRALVETNCAECHAIGVHDESAHEEAPPFRGLLRRYPVDALEEAFAQSIVTGHPDMPEFVATPEQIDAIIGYIAAIQR
ncbi:c-type cytochrome [Roseitalea porphyridii]|uniref:Cytochrome c n=1 Tax=Roseitalea porphyridii TaxID=1852022 RepID=A0A4P6V4A4_9HYPH|nr:cytochrome c [Roseitalea porphyridii]QBK31609.1 cytochrome c [Roseitalea porphyridii]